MQDKYRLDAPLDELLDMARREFEVGFSPITAGGRSLEILQITNMPEYIEKLAERASGPGRDSVELPLWARVWPTAMITSLFVQKLPAEGRSLLDIGSGVGVTGLFAAAAGFRVTLTDLNPEALLFCRINVLKNGLEDRAEVAFADFTRTRLGRSYDFIIGCEVLYRPNFFDPLLDFLAAHFNGSGDGEIVLALDDSRAGKTFFTKAGRDYRVAGRTFPIPGPDGTNRQGAICRMKRKQMIRLESCPKGYTKDLDKAVSPGRTVARVKELLARHCDGVLAETRRVDTGRLGIPVFLSVCGPRARRIMPTRKQMGKGASPDQAEASALMELVERFSFFSFWDNPANFTVLPWSAARAELEAVMPVARVLRSVDEDMDPEAAERIMDLVPWKFHQALNVAENRLEYVPLDWFRTLNEFNGSSAGNTHVESILQGACELVERHVSAVLDKTRASAPVIEPAATDDPVLLDLMDRFSRNGIRLVLNDFSLDLPVPTVAAVAWDPVSFPVLSEIVFTAGTASSPAKAAIRAVTEVAQLAGDFETGRVYEASGLPKLNSVAETAWLTGGPRTPLSALPDVEAPDILTELMGTAEGLARKGYALYSVDTTHAALGVPAHYSFVPGFDFRERAKTRGLGLFVGRMVSETLEPARAESALKVLADICGHTYYLDFFGGMTALNAGDPARASELFARSEAGQPGPEERAMAVFYQAYAASMHDDWASVPGLIDRALDMDCEVKEYFNLRGVARYKAGDYERAAEDFQSALALDSGSAQDLANLGVCRKFLGQRDEAAECLRNALELDPTLENARIHLRELEES